MDAGGEFGVLSCSEVVLGYDDDDNMPRSTHAEAPRSIALFDVSPSIMMMIESKWCYVVCRESLCRCKAIKYITEKIATDAFSSTPVH